MKNKLFILVFFQLFSGFIFCQYHFLGSINDVVIGPQNVDVIFPEQIDFYSEKYNSMIAHIDELQTLQEEELEELEKKIKIRMWTGGKRKRMLEKIESYEIDREIIEETIFLWTQLFEENKIKQLDDKLDSNRCYDFITLNKIYSSLDCQVELDERDSLFWEEFFWQEDLHVKSTNMVFHKSGTVWVKKRANKNCLSNDPNDCLVWCLVRLKSDDSELKRYDGIWKSTLEAPGRLFFSKKIAIEKPENRKYKIVKLRDNEELHIIDFKEKNCN